MKKYLPRIFDKLLQNKLNSSGCVLIKGPKWCGKSTTAEQIAKSVVYMQNPKTKNESINLARNAPDIFLQGETPRLIDEWQIIPFIWDAIRFEVDHRDSFGQFILTGSATPVDKSEIQHTGTGRIASLMMRPMSLFESLDSNGAYSLKDLFSGKYPEGATCNISLTRYAFLLCRGGWPKSVTQPDEIALEIARNYYDGLINEDFNKFDGVKRDNSKIKATLRSYARNIASECSIATIINDVYQHDKKTISDITINEYLNMLRNIFVIDDLPAWNPNLRSKIAIRTSPTRHFVDPSIASAALGIGPNDLIYDLNTFGLLFESLAIRDLKIYAEANDGEVFHYRDKSGLEADAIVHLRNGNWAAFEVKLADSLRIDEGAKNLLKLASKIDKAKMKKPSFLAVITASKYAYKRPDGVFVIPLGCLKD